MSIKLIKFKSVSDITPNNIAKWLDVSRSYRDMKDNKKENICINITTANRIKICLQRLDKVAPAIYSGQITKYEYDALIHEWSKNKFFSLDKESLARAVFRTSESFRSTCDECEEKATNLAKKINTNLATDSDKEEFIKCTEIFYICYRYYVMYVIMGRIR